MQRYYRVGKLNDALKHLGSLKQAVRTINSTTMAARSRSRAAACHNSQDGASLSGISSIFSSFPLYGSLVGEEGVLKFNDRSNTRASLLGRVWSVVAAATCLLVVIAMCVRRRKRAGILSVPGLGAIKKRSKLKIN